MIGVFLSDQQFIDREPGRYLTLPTWAGTGSLKAWVSISDVCSSALGFPANDWDPSSYCTDSVADLEDSSTAHLVRSPIS